MIDLNSLYGIKMCKDINDFHRSKSEHWMQSEYDKNMIDYWKLPDGIYITEMKKHDGLNHDGCDIKNILPAPLGAFILIDNKEL